MNFTVFKSYELKQLKIMWFFLFQNIYFILNYSVYFLLIKKMTNSKNIKQKTNLFLKIILTKIKHIVRKLFNNRFCIYI